MPKWEIGKTIYAGNQANELASTYRTDIESRMKPGEIEELGAGIDELERRRSGQKETLTSQKSNTQDQNITVETLHEDVMDIRDAVKAVTHNAAILKAFGVGEKADKYVSSATAAGNMILEGYEKHKEWANTEAGILDADIEVIQTDIDALNTADGEQEKSKFTRKARTMDKNTLQRRMEDLITKISVTGFRVFRRKDPAVAALFKGLIP